ncbi:hypothetical protein PTT_14799 [Pyrenophora teres f. teres 0-1]|uniref:Uncharacterized protein n=1 Tax=Pyrenophora teres f. teres (strain 0-1) TaxID=861557 RepID=E3RYX4_PYRTT|nr:hypothetical protein PTT_14799 [Pyrenophora teres f. teres 0-1]
MNGVWNPRSSRRRISDKIRISTPKISKHQINNIWNPSIYQQTLVDIEETGDILRQLSATRYNRN